MDKKELKKLWTRVAKGEISEKEAINLISDEKTQPEGSVSKFEGSEKKYKGKKDIKNTRKRLKQVLKNKKESR